jgi:chemotaxis protein MotA
LSKYGVVIEMDIATLLGLAFGITVVSLAILTGSNFSIFMNLPGFLIVVGGTFAATMIKFPLSGVFISMPIGLKAAFMNESEKPRDYHYARRETRQKG